MKTTAHPLLLNGPPGSVPGSLSPTAVTAGGCIGQTWLPDNDPRNILTHS